MLATTRGRLVALSTPFGERGWFYDAWRQQDTPEDRWHRVEVPAGRCPRIGADFLAEERRTLGPRWFEAEYHCAFLPLAGAYFDPADIEAAFACQREGIELD
jgi:hypothetical protein